MTDIDWSRLQPLRMTSGSHTKGSGQGCVMNVVSYITGDAEITDYPQCADDRLSLMLQNLNDNIASSRGKNQKYLSPEDAMTLIELGTLTIGTKDTLPRDKYWVLRYEMEAKHGHSDSIDQTLNGLLASIAGAHQKIKEIADGSGYIVVSDEGIEKMIAFARDVLIRWREIVGLDTTVEVPNLEGVLL